MMRAVIMAWKEEPSYRLAEKVSNLSEVVLLKRVLLRKKEFLDRKTPTFEQEIQNIVSREMRSSLGDNAYLAKAGQEDIFQDEM
jgi:hypothetical protein